jgi:hypothetical protein
MINSDTLFVRKNLQLYNDEQSRRLAGYVADSVQLPTPPRSLPIKLSNDDNSRQEKHQTIDSDQTLLSTGSSSPPLTPESQSLLDDMFSS